MWERERGLPGRGEFSVAFHGFRFAREARAALHQWLQAGAPLGRRGGVGLEARATGELFLVFRLYREGDDVFLAGEVVPDEGGVV